MPYLVVTGLDARGRSRVAEKRPIAPGDSPTEALRIDDCAGIIAEGASDVMLLESPTPAGGALFRLYTWTHGQRTPMHRTTTTDVDVVLQGSVDLELEMETVTLHAGDCAIVPGVSHAWNSSAEGAVVLYGLLTGTPSGNDASRTRARFG